MIHADNALTPREMEIAAFVAAGETNPFIAETLGLSVHTVVHHLRHISNKWGCDNRTQIAVRYATEVLTLRIASLEAQLADVTKQRDNWRGWCVWR